MQSSIGYSGKVLYLTPYLQNSLYQGVSSGYNQDIFLWNAALGYKFLKNQSLEVKAGVNDILNQNSGISRNISQTYCGR
jgi:hypothetical protein